MIDQVAGRGVDAEHHLIIIEQNVTFTSVSACALQPPSKALSNILGKSNLQFAGMSINLNISTSSLNLMTPDSKQVSQGTRA